MTTAIPIRTSSAGPLVVPAPRIPADASTFNGIYMRPNRANGGAVPATGTLCGCPDIWPAATVPIATFQTSLATPASYASDSPSNIVINADNYIYLRGYNGTATARS